jgi:large subunit ribosomal protein L10
MDNPRPEKVAVVAEVRDRLDAAEGVVLTEYRGLDVRAMAELRKALGEAGAEYAVYKNTMVRFAAKELELDIDELLVGPTALAFTGTKADGSAGDPVSMAKALTEFSKGNQNLIIKGGLLEGRPLSLDEISELSKIAPREELLARLAGGMAAPMQQFAALLAAVPQKMAYALKALIEAGGAPGAPESAPAEEATGESEASAEADEEASDPTAENDGDSDALAHAADESADIPDAAAEEGDAETSEESDAAAEADDVAADPADEAGDDSDSEASNEAEADSKASAQAGGDEDANEEE